MAALLLTLGSAAMGFVVTSAVPPPTVVPEAFRSLAAEVFSDGLTITAPTEGTVFLPGDAFKVVVEPANGYVPDRLLIVADHGEVLLNKGPYTGPTSATVTVPIDAVAGSFKIKVFGFDLADVFTESRPVGIEVNVPASPGFDGVTYPVLIENSRVLPTFPMKARKAGVVGNVILEAIIRQDGTVGAARVLRTPGSDLGFEEAAIDALKHWRYKPAKQDGQPVDVYFTIVVEFVVMP
jgi:protein TonB